jgi:hypothetical protein
MSHTGPITEAAISISRNFSLPDQHPGLEDLQKNLSMAICELLLHDYQKLLTLLYRIDVNEKKFQEAFKAGSSELISDKIAILVIEREIEKVESRNKYRE